MSLTRPPAGTPFKRVAVTALLLSALVSGCGVAGTDFQPGVAARVGDETVSVDEVNQIASSYCSAIEPQLKDSQVVPQRYLRGGVVGQLVLEAAARQVAHDNSVKPGTEYTQLIASVQSGVAALPKDQQDAVMAVEAAGAYVSSILTAVGTKKLAESGTAQSDATAVTAAGQKVLDDWLSRHDVSIDPQFGIELKDGQPVPTDTSLSVAVGTTAKNGQAATPDAGYAASLPDSHRCGG